MLLLTSLLCLLLFNAYGENTIQDLKTIMQETISFRQDGKIEIPTHIKHIKLDIGLSYFAPMSQYWLTHEDDVLVFGFEPNPAAVSSILRSNQAT